MNAIAATIATTPASTGEKSIRVLVLVGRLVLAGIFLFASYSKMKPQIPVPWSVNSIETSLSMFAMQVDSYQMLPPSQVLRVSHFLPPFELFLGLWLLSGLVHHRHSSRAHRLFRSDDSHLCSRFIHQLRLLRYRRTGRP
jgi:hypothetical protein